MKTETKGHDKTMTRTGQDNESRMRTRTKGQGKKRYRIGQDKK